MGARITGRGRGERAAAVTAAVAAIDGGRSTKDHGGGFIDTSSAGPRAPSRGQLRAGGPPHVAKGMFSEVTVG